MGVFTGTIPPVGTLVERAKATPDPDWRALFGHVGLVRDAADAAADCARLIAAGEPVLEAWRLGVLQSLDHYESCRRRGGTELASRVYEREPTGRTGAAAIDAAFAAVAEYLAKRDGWPPPAWAFDPSRRVVPPWYPSGPWSDADRSEADRESPAEFRRHGVLIALDELARA